MFRVQKRIRVEWFETRRRLSSQPSALSLAGDDRLTAVTIRVTEFGTVFVLPELVPFRSQNHLVARIEPHSIHTYKGPVGTSQIHQRPAVTRIRPAPHDFGVLARHVNVVWNRNAAAGTPEYESFVAQAVHVI